jgi:hypothetical protein
MVEKGRFSISTFNGSPMLMSPILVVVNFDFMEKGSPYMFFYRNAKKNYAICPQDPIPGEFA